MTPLVLNVLIASERFVVIPTVGGNAITMWYDFPNALEILYTDSFGSILARYSETWRGREKATYWKDI